MKDEGRPEPVRVVVRIRPEEGSFGTGPRICVLSDHIQRVTVLPVKGPASHTHAHSLSLSRSFSSSHGGGAAFSASTSSAHTYYRPLGASTAASNPKPQLPNAAPPPTKSFVFDRVFGPYSTQQEVYDSARPLVESVISGYNATIFAYGCTGSGKTYTMAGMPSHPGIIPRAVADMFTMIKTVTESRSSEVDETMFLVRLTYVELYNNKLKNLLESHGQVGAAGASMAGKKGRVDSRSKAAGAVKAARSISPRKPSGAEANRIEIRESRASGVFLSGGPNIKIEVTNAQEALDLIAAGNRNRSTGSTACNVQSSRSHAVLTFHVESRVTVKGHSEVRMGQLNLVDLAGSERVSLSGAEGDTLVETQNINLSLSSLSNVLSALSKNALHSSAGATDETGSPPTASLAASHPAPAASSSSTAAPVPYRDSKLTYLLKDSLGGNSKTLMITTLRATEDYHQQTMMSLLYAARAKNIRNQTHVNLDVVGDSKLNKMSSEIELLKRRLRERTAELDRLLLAVQPHALHAHAPSSTDSAVSVREAERAKLLSKLEDLGKANEKEKKELEDKLSKVILNQAGQLAAQRQEFSSLQQRLQDEVARYKYTCELQQREIVSLKTTLEALKKTKLCLGASEEEVVEMQRVLEIWQDQATTTQVELAKAAEQLKALQGERLADKQTMEGLRKELQDARARQSALSLEVSALRTAAKDHKEQEGLLVSAQSEMTRLRGEVERAEQAMREAEEAARRMKNAYVMRESEEVVGLQEKLRVAERETDRLRSELERAGGERDEAVRITKVMLDAAEMGDRTSEDIEREIVEARASLLRQEVELSRVRQQQGETRAMLDEARAANDAIRQSLSAAVEEGASLRHGRDLQDQCIKLKETQAQLAEARAAYRALEAKFSSCVSEMEGQFRVVIDEKDRRIQAIEEAREHADRAHARLQMRLTVFERQLETARVDAEALVKHGHGAAEQWRRKAELLENELCLRQSEAEGLRADISDAQTRLAHALQQLEDSRQEAAAAREEKRRELAEGMRRWREEGRAEALRQMEGRLQEAQLAADKAMREAVREAEDSFHREKLALQELIHSKSSEIEEARKEVELRVAEAHAQAERVVADVREQAKQDVLRAKQEIEDSARAELATALEEREVLVQEVSRLQAHSNDVQTRAAETEESVRAELKAALEEKQALAQEVSRLEAQVHDVEARTSAALKDAASAWETHARTMVEQATGHLRAQHEAEMQARDRDMQDAASEAKKQADEQLEALKAEIAKAEEAAAARAREEAKASYVQQLDRVVHEAEQARGALEQQLLAARADTQALRATIQEGEQDTEARLQQALSEAEARVHDVERRLYDANTFYKGKMKERDEQVARAVHKLRAKAEEEVRRVRSEQSQTLEDERRSANEQLEALRSSMANMQAALRSEREQVQMLKDREVAWDAEVRQLRAVIEQKEASSIAEIDKLKAMMAHKEDVALSQLRGMEERVREAEDRRWEDVRAKDSDMAGQVQRVREQAQQDVEEARLEAKEAQASQRQFEDEAKRLQAIEKELLAQLSEAKSSSCDRIRVLEGHISDLQRRIDAQAAAHRHDMDDTHLRHQAELCEREEALQQVHVKYEHELRTLRTEGEDLRVQCVEEVEAVREEMKALCLRHEGEVDELRSQAEQARQALKRSLEGETSQQEEAMTRAVEMAIQECQRQWEERVREAEARVRDEKRMVLMSKEAEWAHSVEQLRAELAARVREVEEQERSVAAKLLQTKEESLRDYVEKLRAENNEAIRRAAALREEQWVERLRKVEEDRVLEVQRAREEEERRVVDEWRGRVAQMMQEKERLCARQVEDARAQACAEVERLKAEAQQHATESVGRVGQQQVQGPDAIEEVRRAVEATLREEMGKREADLRAALESMKEEVRLTVVEREIGEKRVEQVRQEERAAAQRKVQESEAARRQAEKEKREAEEKLKDAVLHLHAEHKAQLERAEGTWSKRMATLEKTVSTAVDDIKEEATLTERWREVTRLAREEARAEEQAATTVRFQEVEARWRHHIRELEAQHEANMREAVDRERARADTEAKRTREARIRMWRHMGRGKLPLPTELSVDGFMDSAVLGALKGGAENVAGGKRPRLLANKLRQLAAERGMIMLACVMDKRMWAMKRKAVGRWKGAVGYRLVDTAALQLTHAAISALSEERRGLIAAVKQLKEGFVRDLSVCRTSVQALTARHTLASALNTGASWPPSMPSIDFRNMKTLPASTTSMKQSSPPPPCSPHPSGPVSKRVGEEMRAALLEGNADRFLNLYASCGYSLPDDLLPYHAAIRGFTFHGSASRMLSSLEAVASTRAEPNAKDPQGSTALHAVLQLGPPASGSVVEKAVEVVMAAGADVGARNARGESPLHVATYRGVGASVVVKLLQAGAEVNLRAGELGVTPLAMLLSSACTRLKRRIHPHRQQEQQQPRRHGSSLHAACTKGEAEVVEVLLNAGALWDPGWRSEDGKNVADLLMTLVESEPQVWSDIAQSAASYGVRMAGHNPLTQVKGWHAGGVVAPTITQQQHLP